MVVQTCSLDPIAILAHYYAPHSAAFELLLQHSRDVANLALAIAKQKPSLPIDQKFLFEAAMLHDIGIFYTDCPEVHCYGREPYIKHGVMGADLLRQLALPYHARVAERHTASGLSHWEVTHQRLPLPLDRSYLPETLEEKLVCYADCFFSKTTPNEKKTPEAILRKMQRKWEKYGFTGIAPTVQRFQELHELFSSLFKYPSQKHSLRGDRAYSTTWPPRRAFLNPLPDTESNALPSHIIKSLW